MIKSYIFKFIDLHTFYPLTSFLDITHIHNYGVSFGLLANLVSSNIIILLGLIVVMFIFYLMLSSSSNLEQWGLLIIISGAISNILDRFLNGFVIDFIYFHYKDFYWPAFNFADIYITIGIIMVILNILLKVNKFKK